jgi:single-strand DNA-binding protein
MKFIGLARIGNDPELRYTSSNLATLQLSLAYSFGKAKSTQWVRATMFGKRAEAVAPHLVKGQLIYVEITEVNINKFTAKDGSEAVSLQGVLQEMEFTGKAEEQKAEKPSYEKPKPVELEINPSDCPF